MSRLLEVRRADGVLTLTLKREDKRNALNAELIDALAAALALADGASDVRVVELRGAGRDFCAGADLDELLASAGREAEENERDALRLGAIFTAMRNLPQPVVAVVRGRALAGGMGLVSACDLVVAAESAQFGYPEILRGFVPAMVMTMLRRQVGEKVAFDLVATGRAVEAAEALRLGLVSRVVRDAELDAAAHELTQGLASRGPSALALTKKLLYTLDDLGFEAGIAHGARINAFARATPEFRLAIEAFLRK